MISHLRLELVQYRDLNLSTLLQEWQVKMKIKEQIVSYRWKEVSRTVEASDDYLARKVAYADIKKSHEPEDSVLVSIQRVK